MNPLTPRPRLGGAKLFKMASRFAMFVWLINLGMIGLTSTRIPDFVHAQAWTCFGTVRYMTQLEHVIFLVGWIVALYLIFVSARLERRAFVAASPPPWRKGW